MALVIKQMHAHKPTGLCYVELLFVEGGTYTLKIIDEGSHSSCQK